MGKLAIAQTCAEQMRGNGILVPHFSLLSMNYQLAATLSDYRAVLDHRISKDNALVEKKMSFQFKSIRN